MRRELPTIERRRAWRLWILLACHTVLLAACGNPRGTIDPRYGDESRFFPDGGIVTTNFTNPNQPRGDRDGWENLQSIVVDSQRQIIAVGTSVYQDGCRGELAVARYRATGVPDDTFGFDGDGTARFIYVNPDLYSTDGVAADVHDDSIVAMTREILQYDCVCGAPCPEGTARATNHVVRITSAGAIDPSFGWKLFDFNQTSDDLTQGQAIAALPDGSVAACGNHYDGSGVHMAVARYDSTGNLDAGFHNGGRWEPDFGGASSFCWDLTVQADGKLIIGGGLNSPELSLVLIRLLPDGSEDPSFNGTGRVVLPTELGGAKFVALSPHVGVADDDVIVGTQAAVLKFLHDGTLDTSFGTNGVTTRPLALFPGGLAIDPEDGTIFVAGTDTGGPSVNRQMFVEAYEPGGTPDRTFGGGRVIVQPIRLRNSMTPGDDTTFNRVVSGWGTSWWGGGLLSQSGRVVVAGSADAGIPLRWDFALVGYQTR